MAGLLNFFLLQRSCFFTVRDLCYLATWKAAWCISSAPRARHVVPPIDLLIESLQTSLFQGRKFCTASDRTGVNVKKGMRHVIADAYYIAGARFPPSIVGHPAKIGRKAGATLCISCTQHVGYGVGPG